MKGKNLMPRRDDYDDDRDPRPLAERRREDFEEDFEDDYAEEHRPLARANKDECNMAMLCHLGGIVGIVIPLVVWLVQKDKSKFVDKHGKEVVNFQITLLIVNLCNAILVMCLIGIVTLMATLIFALVMHIQGSMAASRGEDFRYPLCIRFIK
jgi:uncharacterized Tic20 family protein